MDDYYSQSFIDQIKDYLARTAADWQDNPQRRYVKFYHTGRVRIERPHTYRVYGYPTTSSYLRLQRVCSGKMMYPFAERDEYRFNGKVS